MSAGTVWVVICGEILEGGRVLGVFANEADAEEAAPALAEEAFGVGGWHRIWGEAPYYWECGCDWLEVQEWPVLAGPVAKSGSAA